MNTLTVPSLQWHHLHQSFVWFLHQSFVFTGLVGSSVMNTLTVPSLQRHHLHQSFVCHASNSDADTAVPVTAAVVVDMIRESIYLFDL